MKIIKAIFNRITFMVIAVLLEILIINAMLKMFSGWFAYAEGLIRLLSIVIVVKLINNSRHLNADMIWILMIILMPIPGTLFYIFIIVNILSDRTTHGLIRETANAKDKYAQDPGVLEEMKLKAPDLRGDFRYISESAGFPFYRNTGFDYYGLGDEGYPIILEELRNAREFIFLEYFIIEPGVMWDGILDILKQKAAEGVDVRVLYDDMGSFNTLPASYAKTLRSYGIKSVPFNRINPILGAIMNHRDHRKIMVIDGKTAFSGGVNLADEYINVKVIHGHWKDNIIRIKGEAVWSYTVLFLTNWNALCPKEDRADYEAYRREADTGSADGYIAPYGETPLDQEITGQNIYMNILNSANDYVYIYTPYLIIDTELSNALILTAKKGVDVRIITPGVPDKKIVWDITRSFYNELIKGGVRIYEYTPGFDHAKVFVSDDRVATVGTLNLDYRSLYLHFENGTYLYGSEKVKDIKKDFLDACGKSHLMKENEVKNGLIHSIIVGIVKLFAAEM